MVNNVKRSILGVCFMLSVFIVLGFGSAIHVVTPYTFSVNQSMLNPYVISINNTNQTNFANLTIVNITIPADFVFNGTNATDASATFSNVGLSLIWTNDTSGFYVINGSNSTLNGNDSKKSFTFFATASSTPGNYTITVATTDANKSYTSSVYVQVNDTTNPAAVQGTNPIDGYNSISSSSNLTFDIQCSDNVGVSMIQLWTNITGTWAANYSNLSYANNTWLNITVPGIPDGINYKWAVWCNDTGGLTSLTNNRTLSVNVPTPSQGTNPVDNSYDVDGLVTFDMSCSDSTNISMIQLWTNTTGTWAVNSSNGSYINNTLISIIVPGIPDGQNYQWAVWCNSTAGLSSMTGNRTFNVDKTVPTVILDTVDNPVTVYKPTFYFTPIDINIETCYLYLNDVQRGSHSNLVNGTRYSISPNVNLGDGVNYDIYIRCVDFAGLSGSSDTQNFDVSIGSNNGGSDNSNSDETTTVIDTTSAAANARLAGNILDGDKTVTGLVVGDEVNFSVGTLAHYLIISDVTSNYTVIDISSTPITATINAGETKSFDLDGNGLNDLSITVQGISALKKINIVLRSVKESASNVTNVAANLTATSAPKAAKTRAAPSISIFKNIKWDSIGKFFKKFWLYIVIFIVVVVAVILVIVFRAKIFRSNKKYWWRKGSRIRLK